MIEAAFFGTAMGEPDIRKSAAGNRWASLRVRTGYGDDAQIVSIAAFGEDVAALGNVRQGSKLYIEGRLTAKLFEWNGETKVSLNVACSYCRASHIGRNKPKRPAADYQAPIEDHAPPFDDEIGL